VRIVQPVYEVDMAGATAAGTTCQAIQLGLGSGCIRRCLFVPYMNPLYLAVTMYSRIYVIETISCYRIDPLDTCFS
jgi:hypothetical protein